MTEKKKNHSVQFHHSNNKQPPKSTWGGSASFPQHCSRGTPAKLPLEDHRRRREARLLWTGGCLWDLPFGAQDQDGRVKRVPDTFGGASTLQARRRSAAPPLPNTATCCWNAFCRWKRFTSHQRSRTTHLGPPSSVTVLGPAASVLHKLAAASAAPFSPRGPQTFVSSAASHPIICLVARAQMRLHIIEH